MPNRLFPALGVSVLLAVVGAALPTGVAVADEDCTPSIDQSSVHFTPAHAKLTSKGSVAITVSAMITAPCGAVDASDLTAEIALTPTDFEHELAWNASTEVMPAGDHTYQLHRDVTVRAKALYNVDAPTWDGSIGVQDTDDPGEWNLITYSDPVPVTIRRAAKVSVDAAPEPVRRGNIITVRGKLTRANWDLGQDRALGHQPVALQFRSTTGSYTTVKTVHSGSKGKVVARVTAKKDGTYRFVFAGIPSTASAQSKGDYVNVT